MAIQSTSRTLARLQVHLQAAEHLVAAAAGAVDSFFVKRRSSRRRFAGFLRDSSVKGRLVHSTGGLHVAVCLLHVEPEWEYLTGKLQSMPPLLKRAKDCQTDLFETDLESLPGGFGPLNPLTLSHCAYLAAFSSTSNDAGRKRAEFFLAALVHLLCDGNWPAFPGAAAHPCIAYYVARAGRRMLRDPNLSDQLERFKSESKKIGDVENDLMTRGGPETKKDVRDIRKRVKGLLVEKNSWKKALVKGIGSYASAAERYLWTQLGHVPRPSGPPYLESTRYDPVGACFALNILLDGYLETHGPARIGGFLGEYASLIARTTQHVTMQMTPSGLLAHGLPFVYETQRGTGAFATSVSGLAALAMFWSRCVLLARKQNYPSEAFLRDVFFDDTSEGLFRVIPAMVGSRRSHNVTLGREGRDVEGWVTDRSPTERRVESWVSADVFQFGVFVRELLQELAQMLVLRDLGATLPTDDADAPVWPYPRDTDKKEVRYRDTDKKEVRYYEDPDLEAAETAPCSPPAGRDTEKREVRSYYKDTEVEAAETAPVRFLHKELKKFFPGVEETKGHAWDQSISSVILFGPPGTAKTTLVQSLARALRWHAVELNPGQFIVGGRERLEHRAAVLFNQIGLLRESIILFDELDSIFVDRARAQPGDIVNFIVPAMLPKLQRLARRLKKQRALLVIATNFYDRLDPALVRKGRVDEHLLMLPYNRAARERVLERAIDRARARNQLGGKRWRRLGRRRQKTVLDETTLLTFEELEGVADEIVKNYTPPLDRKPAINGLLYASRLGSIPKHDTLALERLGVEMCGVAERQLDLDRGPVHQNIDGLVKRAEKVAEKMSIDWNVVFTDLVDRLKELTRTGKKGPPNSP